MPECHIFVLSENRNCIDLEALYNLKPNVIASLILKLGLQAFMTRLKEVKVIYIL